MWRPLPNAVQRNITAVNSGSLDNDYCGGFARHVGWVLTPPDVGPGIIVQHVKRGYKNVVDVNTGNALTELNIKNVTANSDRPNDVYGTNEYWEVWTVDNGKTVPSYSGILSNGDDDTFQVMPILYGKRATKNTTKGTFEITGKATFYSTSTEADTPDVLAARLGFKAGNAIAAGAIPSRLSAPAIPNAWAKSNELTRTISVTWDSTVSHPTEKGTYGPNTIIET